MASAHLIGDDEMFLANYGDGLTDAPLPDDDRHGRASARRRRQLPRACGRHYTFHVVDVDDDGRVGEHPATSTRADIWINGGYFVFRPRSSTTCDAGEELVEEPFQRLIDARASCSAYRYEGFWAPMDTLKDKQQLSRRCIESGERAVGSVWETPRRARTPPRAWHAG